MVTDLTFGKEYLVRLTNGRWVPAVFTREQMYSGGRFGRIRWRYHFTNKLTGRNIVLRSKMKIREMGVAK